MRCQGLSHIEGKQEGRKGTQEYRKSFIPGKGRISSLVVGTVSVT